MVLSLIHKSRELQGESGKWGGGYSFMNDEEAEQQLMPSLGPKSTRLNIKYDDTLLGRWTELRSQSASGIILKQQIMDMRRLDERHSIYQEIKVKKTGVKVKKTGMTDCHHDGYSITVLQQMLTWWAWVCVGRLSQTISSPTRQVV